MIGKRFRATLGALVVVACLPNAYAEEACAPNISPNNPIVMEWKGLRLDAPGYVNVRHVWLKVPVAYWFWGSPDQRGVYLQPPAERTDPAFDDLSFSFWMPDGRWLERLPQGLRAFHSCEQGRAEPGPGDFKVIARLEWIGLGWYDDRLPFRTPAEMNRNRLTATVFPYEEREYGLIRFRRPNEQSDQYYAASEGEPFQVSMDCALPGQVPYPTCVARVFWPEEKLLFWMHFAHRDLPHWRKTIETARSLVERWRADADADIARLEQTR